MNAFKEKIIFIFVTVLFVVACALHSYAWPPWVIKAPKGYTTMYSIEGPSKTEMKERIRLFNKPKKRKVHTKPYYAYKCQPGRVGGYRWTGK